MQRAIETHPVKSYEPFELEVTEPGHLRRILTGIEPPSTIIPTSMGQPAVAEAKPHPVLMFEVEPGRPARKRHYVWLPIMTKIDYPGELKFRDTYIDESTGAPLILYEVVNSKK